jgi:hydroxylamine reductase (hybrid-cluster protein)
MALDDAQKDILRQRLEKARLAKIEKKNKVPVASQAQSTEVANPTVIADKPLEQKPNEVEKPPEVKKSVSSPKREKSTNINIQNKKESKEKYAKLVFYKEPSKKSLEKLTRAMNDESDDEPAVAPTKPVIAPKPAPVIDEKQTRMNNLSNMALRFIN